MKSILIQLGRICLVLGLLFVINVLNQTVARAATGPNLITNPSMEVQDGTLNKPTGWLRGKWGINSSNLNYLRTGQDGNRSVKVNISSYTDGDAKWYASPVSINPSSKYVYSDYYRSNISSEIVAQIEDNQGNLSYLWLGSIDKSNKWKQTKHYFTTPAGATKVTIMHLIASKGWLIIDNTSLNSYTPDEAIISNGVPNNSFEQVSDLTAGPLAWQNSKWGTNTTSFDFLNTGHSGNHSAKVQMTSFTDGDAKWYFDPQPVNPGMTYNFSDYYKSDIDTRVVAAVTNSDDSISYFNLKNAPASPTDWTKYSDNVEMPAGAKSVTIFHLIAGVGSLTIDDYGFVPTTINGFNRGLVSLTFDDGWQSIYSNGRPILNAHNAKSTQYIVTGNIDNDPAYMTSSEIAELKADGNQIASHTISHPDLTSLAMNDLIEQLTGSKSWLESKFGAVEDFASPYGAYNSQVISTIKLYYRSHRSVDEGYNSKDNFDLYNIRVQNILSSTTPEQVASWVAKAKADKTWLVLVYHQVDESNEAYSVTPAGLESHLQAIEVANLPIVTVDQAIAELGAQL